MNQRHDHPENSAAEQTLNQALLFTISYLPLLSALLALGLLVIYGLARYNLLGQPAWQLPVIAGLSLLVGLAHLPIGMLARQGRGYLAYVLFAAAFAIWSIGLVVFCEDALPVAILIAWIPPLLGLAMRRAGLTLGRLGISIALSATCTLAVFWLNANQLLGRLSANNVAGTAALTLLASTIVLFALGTVVVRLFRFRSLQGRLVTAFTLIIAVPVLFTTAISAITASNDSQAQLSASLLAISSLKRAQIESLVSTLAGEISTLQQGSGRASSLLHVLDRTGESDADYRLNASVASSLIRGLIVQYPASRYEEVLVVNLNGEVVLSTYTLNQGLSLAKETFFHAGSSGFYAEMIRFPGKQNTAGEFKLVLAAPIYGTNSSDVRGVIVAVVPNHAVYAIMGPTVGLPHARTYLVGSDSKLMAGPSDVQPSITAWPIVHLLLGRQGEVSDLYTNYEGLPVLGYAAWEPDINAAVVAEVPRSDVYSRALASLLVSGLVGLFAVVVAAIAAVSTSRAVSEPIRRLADTAKALSSGDLNARASVEQQDEAGNLAASFNAMAARLQDMIGNLEQRIAERTEALEQQTLRLRAAAEVARDAASAPNLDELLDQAARLIRDRFSLYHTGIFLLDDKKQYAILRASPSEAGKQMINNQHRLRVGEQGIVGRVAATGQPRIALDTGVDPIYFNNPFLPRTRSEMALPLKSSAEIIGVLDIQSDQPEAFTQDDIAIVQVMADQLATAIQRTRLLQQVQTQLNQLERSYQGYTEQSWRSFVRTGRPNLGYKFDNVRLESLKTFPADARLALESDQKLQQSASGQVLHVPLRLRGQTIGIVSLRLESAPISQTTMNMIQQIADRLATALENARLLEESLRSANKERAIGTITTKISASVNMRNVLQTAVEELGRAIPGSEVMIQFRPDMEL